FLISDHFFEPVHKRIYDAINLFGEKNIIATPVTLKNYFDKDNALSEVGGANYLAKIAGLATNIINIYDHGKLIYDLATRRKLITIGEDIVNDAYDNETELNSNNQIEKAEQQLFMLASQGIIEGGGFQHIKISLNNAVIKAQLAFKRKEKLTGISTGFVDLDNLFAGFQDSDLLILAGRPSMGKTALAINLALNSCIYLNKSESDSNIPPSVGFFSLEMSSEQLATRMLSMLSAVNSSALRSGNIENDEFDRILFANKELYKLPFFIDDTPSLTISSLRTRARRLKRKHNMSIIFIDYLQLLRGVSKSGQNNRVQEISEITQGLKAIAKELNIPVVALSQLSRSVEQREDKRPLLSDLRESGSIEQDADIVMFVYREEYYLSRRQPSPDDEIKYNEWQAAMDQITGVAEVIVSKHKNGPIGNIRLHYNSNTTKFSNLVKQNIEI
ncbi:MAG: replicative DNA helicase, partial [Rickettsiales bacterium]